MGIIRAIVIQTAMGVMEVIADGKIVVCLVHFLFFNTCTNDTSNVVAIMKSLAILSFPLLSCSSTESNIDEPMVKTFKNALIGRTLR